MIIFYETKTGTIRGIVEGRKHPKVHHNIWVGDKDGVSRIIVEWNPVKGKYQPLTEQRDLFIELDKKPGSIYEYKIDLKTKALVKK